MHCLFDKVKEYVPFKVHLKLLQHAKRLTLKITCDEKIMHALQRRNSFQIYWRWAWRGTYMCSVFVYI